jgi:citrate lyase subunit beta / citryl-CoA lyase
MAHRSWLVVPGDNEKKLGIAAATGTDVVLADLATLVPYDAKDMARARVSHWLTSQRELITNGRQIARWVCISAMETRQWQDDLAAIMPGVPDGIVLPRAAGPDAVRQLAAELYELEQDNHITPGSTRIMPLVGETPQTALTISAFADALQPRMAAMGWGAECLASAINATHRRDAKGGLTDTFRFVRSQALLAANCCGVQALEAIQPDLVDPKKLRTAAQESKADGFSGMLAYHPLQVSAINAVFTPSEAELERASQIVAAFDGVPEGQGALLDRRLIDHGQLRKARQMLDLVAGPKPVVEEVREVPRMAILRPA